MNDSDRDAYIKYRIEKAEESYEVARLLIENAKWNTAVNRLYYACYHAISALLLNSGVETKSHSGIKTQFFLNFIKPGKLDKYYGKLYSDLFDWRLKGDYGDFFDFHETDVMQLLEPSKDLIEKVKEILYT